MTGESLGDGAMSDDEGRAYLQAWNMVQGPDDWRSAAEAAMDHKKAEALKASIAAHPSGSVALNGSVMLSGIPDGGLETLQVEGAPGVDMLAVDPIVSSLEELVA